MYIAENLRSLRKQNGFTQEKVAEVLRVSPQSVSKWERGDTFPDITLLPCLANLYKTSVDALLGMDRINDDQAKVDVFHKGQKLLRDGDNDGAAAVYTDALKLFPNDEAIMLELALVLALDKDTDKLDRAVSLCESILDDYPAENVFITARAALCYIHQKTGAKKEARNIANNLPHRGVCRDTVLANLDKEPSGDDVNAYLGAITFRQNPGEDILVVDFSLDMVPMVSEGNLIGDIAALRDKAGKSKAGLNALPAVRLRDNEKLPPGQVRIRYYSDYLLDECFDDHEVAKREVIRVLQGLVK